MKVKGISWAGVGTTDFAGTLAFFTEVLGLEPALVDEGKVALLKAGEQVVEIFGEGTRGRETTTPPSFSFEVEDLAAARAELVAKGFEPFDEGAWNGFEWLHFRGPENYVFGVKKSAPPGWEKSA